MRDSGRSFQLDIVTAHHTVSAAVPDALPHPHPPDTSHNTTGASVAPIQPEEEGSGSLCEVEFSALLFASLKDAANTDCVVVRVSAPRGVAITVADFLAQCGLQHPVLAPWLPHVRVAVNCEYRDSQQALAEDDEIALLPPVSGGASYVAVTRCCRNTAVTARAYNG